MSTKNERFLLAIYKKIAEEKPKENTINPFELGKELGYNEFLVKQLVGSLCQSNLLKKYSQNAVTLTPNGEELVHLLKGQKPH